MEKFRTLRPVTFPAGTVLALDDHQAATRKHVLYDMEPGVYVAREAVTFKANEIVGLMTPPTKGGSGLEPVEMLEMDIPDEKNTHGEKEAAGESPEAASSDLASVVDARMAQAQESTAESVNKSGKRNKS